MEILINKAIYDEDYVDTLFNINLEPPFEFQMRLREVHPDWAKSLNTKKLFKDIFGPQQITKLYSRRNWIWTFATTDLSNIIYCMISTKGCEWDYDKRSTSHIKLRELREAIMHRLLVSYKDNEVILTSNI